MGRVVTLAVAVICMTLYRKRSGCVLDIVYIYIYIHENISCRFVSYFIVVCTFSLRNRKCLASIFSKSARCAGLSRLSPMHPPRIISLWCGELSYFCQALH